MEGGGGRRGVAALLSAYIGFTESLRPGQVHKVQLGEAVLCTGLRPRVRLRRERVMVGER